MDFIQIKIKKDHSIAKYIRIIRKFDHSLPIGTIKQRIDENDFVMGFEMAEFQEGTLDTMMERLCSSISGFDPEWVTRCVSATEEQIRQLQDIFAECHYTVPTAYLYYLRRMGQNDGGLLEDEGDGEVDIDTVLELLPGKGEDLEKGLFQFSDHWADACFYMKLSNTEDNPMVTDWGGVYVTESFEKYLFRKAFHMYQRGFTYTDFRSESVCDHHERKKKENCRTCPYCGETVEERMDFINQMAERLMVYSAQCRCCNNAFDSEFLRKEVC